jgi:dTDP-4-dehydrorhamnose reductase
MLDRRCFCQCSTEEQGAPLGMRVLILGAAGMLGHKVWQACRNRFDVWAAVRSRGAMPPQLHDPTRLVTDVDATRLDSIVAAFAAVRPDVVINCIGIVKQSPKATEAVPALLVNALFPHRLAALCRASDTRLIHVSTDCVFSGHSGPYSERDPPDADDLYGRTKLLGELTAPGTVTLRTSMIGRELTTAHGLLEWFLSHRGGAVRGYRRALFSGPTTNALARLIVAVLEQCPDLTGLYHVAAEPIDKYDLLCRLNAIFRADVRIEPSDEVRIDRSLDGSRLQAAMGWTAPPWDDMLEELRADPTPYDQWREM